MATKSGKDGKVLVGTTELASITHWSLQTVSHNPAHASSATGGVKTRNPGVKDSSGTIRFKLDFTDPITGQFVEGSLVTLKLYLDAARFYIDLLGSFHARWGEKLGPQESRFVESYLDQLRLRFVSHTG